MAAHKKWNETRDMAEASQELLETPEIQGLIVEKAPTIVLLLDEQGRIAKVNSYFEKKTGFPAESVIGRDWFATFIPQADRPVIRELFSEVLARGVNSGHVNPILTKDGNSIEVEWYSQIITDPQRRSRWLLNIGHDVTERLEYEKALEAAKGQAERANAAKSRFLATASHDLRQPLQTLLLLNGALTRRTSDPQIHQMLGMQRDALGGMGALLNALLDIGKLESGAIAPEITDVPVHEVFERIRAELGPQAAEKGVALIVEDCALVARTDFGLLTQLVQNVVANGIRYTIEGRVTLACARKGSALEIVIEDTGIGIAPEQRELIFDEFYQVDRNVSNGGLGLGLSIVKRIADLLDFEIALDSELGKGSTFRFTVPAAVGYAPVARPATLVEPRRRTGTVLLIDDDAAVLAASRLFLEVEGFDVIAAGSPEQVATKLDSDPRRVDLIVTDYHLNDLRTGIDIVESVRERLGRAVPAIVVTGDTSPSMDGTSVAQLQIVRKPIQPHELLAVAGQLLAAAR